MGLLVGCSSREGRTIIGNLLGPLLNSATICGNAADLMLQILEHRELFHWVLVEGEASGPEGRKLTRLLREYLYDVPITFFSFPTGNPDALGLPPALLCAVEHSSRGKKVLNCQLVERSVPGLPNRAPGVGALLYEYQGPVSVEPTTDSGSSQGS